MKRNTALVVSIALLGLTLSYIANQVPVGGKIALACVFALVATSLALTAKEV